MPPSAPSTRRGSPTSVLAAKVAAAGLPGSLHDRPDAPLHDRLWERLLDRVREQRLTGLLASAVSTGSWPATDEQYVDVLEAHVRATFEVLELEHLLLVVVDQLAAAGVDARVLKGSAVAHLDYPQTHERVFGDVDLLVRGADFDRAVETLVRLGYHRRFPQPRRGFDSRFSKGTSFVSPDGFELDLHRTFVMGPFGLLVDLDQVWAEHQPFTVGGQSLAALAPDVRFLHACFHAALGDAVPRLMPQRDVVQLLLGGSLDMNVVRELMSTWRAQAVVARAVTLAWETLAVADVVALSAWAQRYTPSAQERRYLKVYTDTRGSYAAKELAALSALPRTRDRVAFLHALVLPERQYLDGRHAGRTERLRRALMTVRPGAREGP